MHTNYSASLAYIMFFLKKKKKKEREKIPNTPGTKTVMAWNQFCKCQDIGLEFSRESKRISSSNPIENLPYTLWTNYRNSRSLKTAALANVKFSLEGSRGAGVTVGLQGGHFSPKWLRFLCVLPSSAGCWRDVVLPAGLGGAAASIYPSSREAEVHVERCCVPI